MLIKTSETVPIQEEEPIYCPIRKEWFPTYWDYQLLLEEQND